MKPFLLRHRSNMVSIVTDTMFVSINLLWSRQNDELSTHQFEAIRSFAKSLGISYIYDEEHKEHIKLC